MADTNKGASGVASPSDGFYRHYRREFIGRIRVWIDVIPRRVAARMRAITVAHLSSTPDHKGFDVTDDAGVTTFLFTDIEGSTRLWEEQSERMRPALANHDAAIREAVESNRGICRQDDRRRGARRF